MIKMNAIIIRHWKNS